MMFIHDIICNQGCRGINTVGAEHLLPTPTLLTAAVISFQTRCLCLFNASFQPGNNLIFFALVSAPISCGDPVKSLKVIFVFGMLIMSYFFFI